MLYFLIFSLIGAYDKFTTWYALHFIGVKELNPIGRKILSKFGQKGMVIFYLIDIYCAIYMQYLSTYPIFSLIVGYGLSFYIIAEIVNTYQLILLIRNKPPRKEVWSPDEV